MLASLSKAKYKSFSAFLIFETSISSKNHFDQA
jgi:hypothetical protein